MASYIVCGSKPWCEEAFELIKAYPGDWHYMSFPLAPDWVDSINPRYIFFLHWNYFVPDTITKKYECVNFHMTDLPYGRGGSPLQNLILRGHTETVITAHRMTDRIDEGPIYEKTPMSLHGNADAIYKRAMQIAAAMIVWIVAAEPEPTPQEGIPEYFNRRIPDESEIPQRGLSSPTQMYNFIRMLDAETYPRAFLDYGGFRFTFKNAILGKRTVLADVEIEAL